MTTLVTGGSGVVGMQTSRRLAEMGEDVIAFSTSGEPQRAELVLGEYLGTKVRFVRGDIRDPAALEAAVKGVEIDGIIHTAGITGEGRALSRTGEVMAVNVGGTINVLELARERGVRRVVYTGSSTAYGRRPDLKPCREDEIDVQGLYGESKYVGHRLGQRYREVLGVDVRTARVSAAYGPYTRARGNVVGNALMGYLCRAVAKGEPLHIESGADYPRGWTYSADTALGICLLYKKENPKYDTYNIASGEIYTGRELIETMKRIEPGADVSMGPGQWEDNPLQVGNLRGPMDITRAREDLGFEPRYTLEEGLRSCVEWWRNVEGA